MKLLSVSQAEHIILNAAQKPRVADCPLAVSTGKIIAENIAADRDQPSADRSSMDGIAVPFKAWKKGCREFHIEGVQKAGIPAKKLSRAGGCFEIMTGAVIPQGCDCVIPIEGVKIFGRRALVSSEIKVRRFQFIRKQGSEYKKGALLLNKGAKINTPHIAVAASVGKSKIKVFSPKIAVIGTGDELVELNKDPKTHQSRRSNAYALEALFSAGDFTDVSRFHLNDNAAVLKRELKKIISGHDVLVLSGGVSMGKFDLVPQALTALGVKIIFHKVNQKPGKPLLFAQARNGTPVFGLPGNPVSTIVCAARYVLPYLNKICGIDIQPVFVSLGTTVKQHERLSFFLPVSFNKSGQALPVGFAGSGDYGALTRSAGFVEIPPGKGRLKKGTGVKFFSW